jgi:hypothetical protein
MFTWLISLTYLTYITAIFISYHCRKSGRKRPRPYDVTFSEAPDCDYNVTVASQTDGKDKENIAANCSVSSHNGTKVETSTPIKPRKKRVHFGNLTPVKSRDKCLKPSVFMARAISFV